MTTNDNTTARPWAFDQSSGEIVYDDGDVKPVIATVHNDNTSDAQFLADGALIVRAVNAHDALVAALRECVPFCKGHQETPEKAARYQRVLTALAKAER
jgi:hypothetical protein